MGLLHYFSKDTDKRSKFIFNLIAPIYSYLSPSIEKTFSSAIKALNKEIPIEGKTIMDIGTGTGAWAANFLNAGAAKVVGLDFADKMLIKARMQNPGIEFYNANAENLHQFQDNSFDIVTASFVLHGVKQNSREAILKEMKRVARNYVVLHDFVGKTPFLIRILEFMERSDYKFFKLNICKELKMQFLTCSMVPVKYGTGIYYARK
ncbi:MAG: class I SAM-dependent methyltransferase [Bacteroidota bacterium]|jgi:ubiquinone/menaquinone biosynthesis C-methylase UbiE